MSRANAIIQDLGRLKPTELKVKGRLTSAPVRNNIVAGKGVGYAGAQAQAGTGSGIAFPLTEQPGTRTYYPERYLTSTDGFFSFAWAPPLRATFQDGTGAEGPVNYADPDA